MLRKRESEITQEYLRMQGRAANLASHMGVAESLDWFDMAGSGMVKAVDDYRKHKIVDSLLEIRRAVAEMHAIIEELIRREEQ